MNIFASKIILVIVFLITFNINSIAFAYEEPIKNEIRLEEKNYFTYSTKNKNSIIIDSDSKIYNKVDNFEYFDIGQIIATYFFEIPFILPVYLVITLSVAISLYSIKFPENSEGLVMFIFNMCAYTSFLLVNSVTSFITGKDNYNKSYLITLLGSFVGILLYLILDFSAIFIESYTTPNINDSIITKNQISLFFLLAPLFASISASIFYNLSKDNSIKDPKKLKDEISKIQKNYHDFYSKVNIKKGEVSVSLFDF